MISIFNSAAFQRVLRSCALDCLTIWMQSLLVNQLKMRAVLPNAAASCCCYYFAYFYCCCCCLWCVLFHFHLLDKLTKVSRSRSWGSEAPLRRHFAAIKVRVAMDRHRPQYRSWHTVGFKSQRTASQSCDLLT